ncbi:MAG: UTP--glucose-1-phosphate uridylyltransferase [Candidatus Berkelbacteria bacterium]
MQKIRKAVIPVAGYGTRFLPVTKAMPKEMLPIVDKPTIQYIVEELVEAGITQIILVTGWHKRAIEDHFDRHFELETKLKQSGKLDQLAKIRKITDMAEFVYVRQKEMRGNGDAILAAKNVVGDEPFIVCWGDEILEANPLKTTQLIEAYNKYGTTILGCIRSTDPEAGNKYGFAKGDEVESGIIKVDELIEKPGVGNEPSPYSTLGGYIFNPDIFAALESIEVEEGQELVYIDAVNALMKQGTPVHAAEIKNSKHYDCGNVMEYLKTNVEMALKRPDIGSKFKDYLEEVVNGSKN